MKRIPLLAALILLSALVITTVGSSRDTGAKAIPDHITLTWTGDPATTMTITWRTDDTVTSGVVQYQKGSKLSATADQTDAVGVDFDTDLGACRIFTARLVGLSPNTKYAYRVGDGEHWSEVHTFTTAAPKPAAFRFLVFGDSQSSASGDLPYGQWRTTVQNAYKANPSAKFMVCTGDLVSTGQSCEHWNAWFSATTGLIDTIPMMPVLGNHEYSGRGAPSCWTTQFPLPQNGPEGLKNRVYSYDYGRVHFTVLDSKKVKGKNLASVQEWLDSDLADSNAIWKVVFFHEAPYEVRDGRSNDELRAALCPILERHRVDAVFSGHDHGIARTYPIKDGRNMRKPSQGTIYFTTGRSGDKTYENLSKRAWHSFFHNPLDQPNYFVVEVNDMKLTVRTVNQDGTPVDNFVIDKRNDTTSDGR